MNLIFWRPPRTNDLDRWVLKHLTPIDRKYVSVIKQDDKKNLEVFAKYCHQVIQDRDLSFTLEERIRLYRRWLSSEQSCLMAINDEEGNLISTSVVLPLTKTAYDEFCFGERDVLKIEASDIVKLRDKQKRRYLLVDILAVNKELAAKIPGAGFGSIIRHIALFYNPLKNQGPVILCSTENMKLIRRLLDLEFEQKNKQLGTNASIYRADLSNLDLYSPKVREYYVKIIDLIKKYQ